MNQTSTTIWRSLQIQKRVIFALLMREIITRYGRHNIGFMWLFVEPMMFTLGVTTVWSLGHFTHGSNLPIAAFAVTGYSSLLVWRNSGNRCSKAIEPNLSLMYHRNVRVIDVFLSRLILELAGATASLTILVLVFMAVGLVAAPVDLLTMSIGWILQCWFAMSLGLTVGAVSERSEVVERIWHTITYLMFPFSGAVFMVDWLPKSVQNIVLWLPMVHGAEMIRHGFFGNAVRTHENPAYFIFANSILMLIGLSLARETQRRVEPE
ncbi:ABC transporter permease [Paraburkholderia sp. RP-4-7]|uniref:Transport permease protein n=1 Tax=Paraburkholderia polaris TaxID=2728848 RepID=A0A848IQ68_9BURK|nr:ABC transporter permease [Paraburkholderia polaris]NMM01954.1 ABC transporter permease [Paraburkholderia polaris]